MPRLPALALGLDALPGAGEAGAGLAGKVWAAEGLMDWETHIDPAGRRLAACRDLTSRRWRWDDADGPVYVQGGDGAIYAVEADGALRPTELTIEDFTPTGEPWTW